MNTSVSGLIDEIRTYTFCLPYRMKQGKEGTEKGTYEGGKRSLTFLTVERRVLKFQLTCLLPTYSLLRVQTHPVCRRPVTRFCLSVYYTIYTCFVIYA